jgi:hypothetical protein
MRFSWPPRAPFGRRPRRVNGPRRTPFERRPRRVNGPRCASRAVVVPGGSGILGASAPPGGLCKPNNTRVFAGAGLEGSAWVNLLVLVSLALGCSPAGLSPPSGCDLAGLRSGRIGRSAAWMATTSVGVLGDWPATTALSSSPKPLPPACGVLRSAAVGGAATASFRGVLPCLATSRHVSHTFCWLAAQLRRHATAFPWMPWKSCRVSLPLGLELPIRPHFGTRQTRR